MTTPATVEWPKPSSDDEFENMATDAMSRRWRTPSISRHGRSGQAQFGVDATAMPSHLAGAIAGLQYKNVVELTIKDVRGEVAKAEAFTPQIAEYWIVTSLDRDAPLHREVRQLSLDRRETGKFSVEILFWQDLCSDLATDEALIRKYYPWLTGRTDIQLVIEHRHSIAATPASTRPPVNWETFYAMLDDNGPRASAFLKIVAMPTAALCLKVDGSLLDEFQGDIQRVFGHLDPSPPSWTPRADAVELLWRQSSKGISRHWMRGQDGSVGFATTIESSWRAGYVSLWEVALDVLLFFRLAHGLLGRQDTLARLEFQPHKLQPTRQPLAPADERKSPLSGLPGSRIKMHKYLI